LGNWENDFRLTDTFINASTVYFMVHAPNAAYSQALFQMLFFGNDTINLSPFDDAFDAGFGSDLVFGHDGNDLLNGGDGDDRIEGGLGRDVLAGGVGADLVFGDWGADRLTGGRGADHLFGGTGGDTFFYESRGEGRDHIRDFKSNDTIAFKASAFGGLVPGALDPSMFVVRAADNLAQDADDHFIYDASAKKLWFDNNGNADGGLFPIAKIDGSDVPTVDDILLL
jgi:Ca2+-binding RTX toxin-like protein